MKRGACRSELPFLPFDRLPSTSLCYAQDRLTKEGNRKAIVIPMAVLSFLLYATEIPVMFGSVCCFLHFFKCQFCTFHDELYNMYIL